MSKDSTELAKDFWGNTIAPGDVIAAPVMMQGFITYARRKVVSVDDEGALVCTNMDGKPVNRVKKPKKTFKQPNTERLKTALEGMIHYARHHEGWQDNHPQYVEAAREALEDA